MWYDFFLRRLRKVKKYIWMLYMYRKGFQGVFANRVDDNLVFLKHPFAIHKTLCKHFSRGQIIFVMCISDYLFDRRDYYLCPTKKKGKRKKENILCNLTSTKNQNESKQLRTHHLLCCLTILNVCTRQLARGLMLIWFWQLLLWARESSGLRKCFLLGFFLFVGSGVVLTLQLRGRLVSPFIQETECVMKGL